MSQEEVFKDIPIFTNYQISNLGNIKVKKTGLIKKNHILGKGTNKKYFYCTLWIGTAKKNKVIHRLVAEAFIPNPHNHPVVNHIDNNSLNNSIENLEWCTFSYNNFHAYETGSHIKRKPITQYSLEGEVIKKWSCINQACVQLGYNPGFITTHIKRKSRAAYGFIWKRD